MRIKVKIISILFVLLILSISISLIGCDRDGDLIISPAEVENIEIYVSETGRKQGEQQLFPVVAIVRLSFPDSCSSYHDTEYPMEYSTLRQDSAHSYIPIRHDGDTIEFKITASDFQGTCFTAVYFYDEAIFIGLCFPGDYTLRVNDREQTFTVGTFRDDFEAQLP